MNPAPPDRIAGVILGTAIGDSLGLPAEGLRPGTIRRIGWRGNWRHRFFGKRGMWSDDTEHTIMLCQSLLSSQGSSSRFARDLGWELRWWLLGLPSGVGFATARAILRLWAGIPPQRSGVFSAGNGPCMRTAIIGACFPNDKAQRQALTEAHTRLTHSDPKALIAASAVTELSALLAKSEAAPPREAIINAILPADTDEDWREIVDHLQASWDRKETFSQFLARIGIDPDRGISGYAYHTVPAVIYAGVKNRWDYRKTITALLDAGGDADTTAAIGGALCGAFGGESSLPPEWLDGIAEWPTGTKDLRKLATALSENTPIRVRSRWSLSLLLRNLFFLLLVLAHGFSRPLFYIIFRSNRDPSVDEAHQSGS